MLIVIILPTGIALLTIAIVRIVDRKVRFAYQPSRALAGPFLEAFALYLVGYMGIGYLAHLLKIQPVWLVYVIELIWIAGACCWPLARGVSFQQLRAGLGWNTGQGILREALAGVGGYLAGMPLMAGAISLTALLSKLSGEKPIHPIVFGAGGKTGAIIGLFLLASVFAPIVEETMFRGALFNYLRASHRWIVSALLSGVIFASLHPQGWTAIPVLATIGIIFAGIREWRGTVVASGVAHALNNAVATTMLVLMLG
jgi:membrane protease YdiL (CAAX protease family)